MSEMLDYGPGSGPDNPTGMEVLLATEQAFETIGPNDTLKNISTATGGSTLTLHYSNGGSASFGTNGLTKGGEEFFDHFIATAKENGMDPVEAIGELVLSIKDQIATQMGPRLQAAQLDERRGIRLEVAKEFGALEQALERCAKVWKGYILEKVGGSPAPTPETLVLNSLGTKTPAVKVRARASFTPEHLKALDMFGKDLDVGDISGVRFELDKIVLITEEAEIPLDKEPLDSESQKFLDQVYTRASNRNYSGVGQNAYGDVRQPSVYTAVAAANKSLDDVIKALKSFERDADKLQLIDAVFAPIKVYYSKKGDQLVKA